MIAKVEYLGEIPISMVEVKDRYRGDMGELELLAEDLKLRGLIHPICVGPISGGKKVRLRAGHRRLEAAKLAGWETIRAEQRVGDDKIEALEVERSENYHRQKFKWDELARLEKAIYDMRSAKDPNWSVRQQAEMRDSSKSRVHERIQLAEALDLLPELAEFEHQHEAFKHFKKLEEDAVIGHMRANVSEDVRRAPEWAERHYIVGDSLTCMAGLEAESVDFAEIDPPYAMELLRRKDRNQSKGHTGDYNEIDAEEYPSFMGTVCSQVYRVLKPNSFAVFWYAMQWHTDMYRWLTEAGFAVNPMPAIWYKGQSGQTAQPDIALASTYEPFFLARKGKPRMIRQGRANVFYFSPVPSSRKIHPTERPIELMEDILNTILFPGSTVLVPFLGSGVTLRAAYRTGHTGFGYDLAEGNRRRFLDIVAKELSGETVSDEAGAADGGGEGDSPDDVA
jgi:adenine-specific DNA-methyltransferase